MSDGRWTAQVPQGPEGGAVRSFPFSGGWVDMAGDGAVARVRHPRRGHSVLLAEEPAAPDAVLHEAAYRWGKGFVISDQGSHRFDAPTVLVWTAEGVEVGYRLGDLELTVSRRVEGSWIETTRFATPLP